MPQLSDMEQLQTTYERHRADGQQKYLIGNRQRECQILNKKVEIPLSFLPLTI